MVAASARADGCYVACRWAGLFVVFRVTHALQLSLPKKVPIAFRAVSFYATIALLGTASVSLLIAGKKK